MPPKGGNTSWWPSSRQSDPPTRETTRTPTNESGPPPRNAGAAAHAQTNQDDILGMPELIEFVTSLANLAPGTKPQLVQEHVEKIKKSPLKPVLVAFQPIYRKFIELAAAEAEKDKERSEFEQKKSELEQEKSELEQEKRGLDQEKRGLDQEKRGLEQEKRELEQGKRELEREKRELEIERVKIQRAPSPAPSEARTETPATHHPAPTSTTTTTTTTTLDPAALRGVEASLKSLSAKLESLSQDVNTVPTSEDVMRNFATLEGKVLRADAETRDAVKASTTATDAHFHSMDTKVTQLTAKLDPALTELTQGIKKLQVGLLGEQRTKLEARIAELEKELKDTQAVVDATRAELLPVEVAAKIALQGSFTDETERPNARAVAGAGNAAGGVLQTAKRVRTNTLGLITKCRALFAFINRDPQIAANVPDLGTEGEWGRCAEHLRASNTRLRTALSEAETSSQKLQFVGFVVEQIRKGKYSEKEWRGDPGLSALLEKAPDGYASVRLLVQDLSKATSGAMSAAAATATAPHPVMQVVSAGVTPPTPVTAGPTVTSTSTANRHSAADPDTTPTTPKGPAVPAPAPKDAITESIATNAAGGSKVTSKNTTRGKRGQQQQLQPNPSTTSATSNVTPPTPLTASTPAPPTHTTRTPILSPAPRTKAMSRLMSPPPTAPMEPEPPRSPTPVVTAPSSPAVPLETVLERMDEGVGREGEMRPAPTRKSSSYFRTRSELNRRSLGPLSGWGPLIV